MNSQSGIKEQKRKLVEEINQHLEQDTSLQPAVRKAIRLADLCKEVEYRMLFELHLDGVDPNGTSGTRVPKWHDQNVQPKWDILKAFFEDRDVRGQTNGSSISKIEHILEEVRDQKRTLRGLGRPAGELLITMEAESSEVLGRIRNRIGRFAREVETALLHEDDVAPQVDTLASPAPVSAGSDMTEKKETWLSEHKATIIGALITLVGVLIVGYWQFVYKPKQTASDAPVQYTGRVIDSTNQKTIRGAKVSIEAQGPPQILYTDSEGVFYVKLNGSAESVRVRVEAANYEGFDRTVSLNRTGTEEIRLTPLAQTNGQRRTR